MNNQNINNKQKTKIEAKISVDATESKIGNSKATEINDSTLEEAETEAKILI